MWVAMLELRPNCECCDRDVSPNDSDARICTFECTFCADCVDGVLDGNAYKELSGGNGVTISCSRKYGHEIETKFSGLVVLLTNNRLNFKPLDGALAGRMLAM